jgi:HNH endonuclease/AP2 domain
MDPRPIKERVSIKRLHELFEYDTETGFLIRKKGGRRGVLIKASKIRRKKIYIDGNEYSMHTVCFAHYNKYWAPVLVDHKDGDISNTKPDNLREATHTQNQQNIIRSNPHGYKGVTWRNRKKKPWLSKIRIDGVRINLGSFATAYEAAVAYENACIKYHGEFANLGVK